MPQPVLTEEKRNAIVAILSVGCPRYVAARYVGCSPATIARTAARDPQFAARLRQAQAGVELAFLRRIGKAADKEQYWRAAAWALERMFPQRYARRDPRDSFDGRQVQAALEVLAELLCGFLPVAARRELRHRLARAVDQLRRGRGAAGRGRSSRRAMRHAVRRGGSSAAGRSPGEASRDPATSKPASKRRRRSQRRRSAEAAAAAGENAPAGVAVEVAAEVPAEGALRADAEGRSS